METFDLDYIRRQIIGNDLVFKTPFGERNILYADYTASGRGLTSIEEKLKNILRSYANTHTEDDYSGKYLTRLFHQVLKRIKELVNAGEKCKVISVGSGSTGALKKLQEIIGVYIPPATKERIFQSIDHLGKSCRDVQDRIERIEAEFTKDFLSRLKRMPNIDMVGRVDPEEKIPIISFNIRHLDRILHPKFVTKLLNDLFGIQSRAGCSCAGPYGHLLLEISDERSSKYRAAIQQGLLGLKPGWVRINIHYTFSRDDVDFLVRAIDFVATHGHLFLSQYIFDIHTGEWKHIDCQEDEEDFSITNAFETKQLDLSQIKEFRDSYFQEAEKMAQNLKKAEAPLFIQDKEEIESLKSFYYCSQQGR